MHSDIDKIEIMTNDKSKDVIQELVQSFLSRCQIELEIVVVLSLIVFIYCTTNFIK